MTSLRGRTARLVLETLEDRAVPALIAVNTFADEDDGFLGGSSGTSLREAIRYSAAGDTIQLQAGTYRLTRLGPIEDIGSTGDLDVSRSLTITGAGAQQTIVDGNSSDRAFDIQPGVPGVTISDLTVRNGVAFASSSTSPVEGGGIRNNGHLTLLRTTVTNNRTAVILGRASGGGLWNGPGATLELRYSTVSNNTVEGGTAMTDFAVAVGSMGAGGGIYTLGRLDVRDSTIADNQARGGQATTQYGTAVGGEAYGAGIASGGTGAEIEVVNSTISGNVATGGEARVVITNFGQGFGGVAKGGGLFDEAGGDLNVVNSTISGNRAVAGPGFSGGGDSSGGGLYVSVSPDDQQAIDHATITLNEAVRGGGLLATRDAGVSNVALLRNSIVAGNLAGTGVDVLAVGITPPPAGVPAFVSRGRNLIGSRGALGELFLDPTDLGFATPSVLLDARLGPLGDNGGPTRTHALLSDSPAIDAGSNPLGLLTDQRGLARQIGSAVDIGAFEAPARPAVESVRINDGTAQRSRVTSITITFNAVVTLDPGAITLARDGGSLVGLSLSPAVSDGRSVVTVTFTGGDVVAGSLADGRYRLTIDASRVRAGSEALSAGRVVDLHRLFGDGDGDADVDALDALRFRAALLGGAYAGHFDYDGDGDVDGLDLAQFNLRRGTRLP